jgi:hypothetical protein
MLFKNFLAEASFGDDGQVLENCFGNLSSVTVSGSFATCYTQSGGLSFLGDHHGRPYIQLRPFDTITVGLGSVSHDSVSPQLYAIRCVSHLYPTARG